ncbi:MAG: hypothetical protein UZ21_OP11001001091 [Microgenomates bacterium OLB22]|nr:MAG: hypothetical protein UZ21_OP11001001091 [Microgenomates bacterium OLB22]
MQRFLILVSLVFVTMLFVAKLPVQADELEDIGKELNALKQSLESSQRATRPLEAELEKARKQVTSIQQKILTTQLTLAQKEQDLRASETILEGQKKLMDAQIEKHYKTLKTSESLPTFFSSTASMSNALRGSSYQEMTTDQNKQLILRIVRHILFTEEHKQRLEQEKVTLASYKKRPRHPINIPIRRNRKS